MARNGRPCETSLAFLMFSLVMLATCTTAQSGTSTSITPLDNDIASPEIIIVTSNATSLADRNRTFYEVDEDTTVTVSTPRNIFTTTVPYVSTRRSNTTSTGTTSTTPAPSSVITPRPSTRTTSTTVRASTTTTATSTTTTTTTAKPIIVREPSSTSETPYADLRLRSNLVTLKPTEVLGFHESVSSFANNTNRLVESSINNGELDFPSSQIWKIILHGTNMNQEELKLCNKSLIESHFKPYSRRRVGQHLKKELDNVFGPFGYRFSVLISATSKNTMGKALHGVWLSMSLNGLHYFLTATYKIVESPKLTEAQVDKVEYWASLHTFSARNMTGYRHYNRIAQKLKADLDREYGSGNVWSVVIVKNRYYIKARILEDAASRIEFARLNGGHFIVWRGGQDIDGNGDGAGRRNARVLNTLDSSFDEDGNDEHGSESKPPGTDIFSGGESTSR